MEPRKENMKAIGTLTKVSATLDNAHLEFDLALDEIGRKNMIHIHKMKPNEEYVLTIENKSAARTYKQNAYLWALISEICREPNSPRHDEWELYLWLLKESKASYFYVQIPEEAVDKLKRTARALEVIKYNDTPKGKLAVCQVFEGSSKMSRKEMNVLIDTTLSLADELELDTTLYREVLK